MPDPIIAKNAWCKTFQDDWLKQCPGGDVSAMAWYWSQYGTLFLSNVGGINIPGRRFPKPAPGTYQPVSNQFGIYGWTPRRFVSAIKSFNPYCRIFPYVCAVFDNVSGPWDPVAGMPPPGPWLEGGWENFRHAIYWLLEDLGTENVDGFFVDLSASPYLSGRQMGEVIAICKSYGKYVALNINFASVENAKWALASSPWLGIGDYLMLEGLWYDSWIGWVKDPSIQVCKFMQTQYVRFAASVEHIVADIHDPNQMYTQEHLDIWYGGNNLFLQYAKDGDVRENNNQGYAHRGYFQSA